MRNGYRILAVCLAIALVPLVAGIARSALLINGAGSTFAYPINSKWFDAYAKIDPSVQFNYQSIGSGGGISMLRNKSVDFGGTDAPLNDTQMAGMPGPVLHFPSVMGADVVAYNLPGVNQKLRFTGPVIADIFLGNIVKWSDPAIAKLNPGVKFPDESIVTVHRSDGSGTTFIFADYLSKVSPQWAKVVGKGTSLKWPVGLGGKGNEGVTGIIQQTPNSIGYNELTYSLANKITFAEIQNRAGNYVDATLAGVTAAAAGAAANMPDDFRVSITDAPGADSYPISSFTWLLVYKNQTDKERCAAMVKFLKWCLTDGQKYAAPLFYAPLPQAMIEKELQQINQINLP